MKPWQFLPIGIVALLAVLLLPFYEGYIAGAAAVLIVAAVFVGFCFQPQQNFYRVHTKAKRVAIGGGKVREHDLLAVKVELSRLWLLFIPTISSVCFLVVTAARGTTWNFGLLERLNSTGMYNYLFLRATGTILFITFGLLSAWLSERWVLRDVIATYAISASVQNGRLGYVFLNKEGSYYGGSTFPFGTAEPAVAKIVFYCEKNPERNKIAGGFLFHRVIVLGRGLTDLDFEATETHLQKARPGMAESSPYNCISMPSAAARIFG